MPELFRQLRPYLRLVSAFPLHLIAAFVAALISEILLTIQPRFLRGFIDQAQAGLGGSELWVFPAFMLGAAVLSYAFEFISVAIGYYLETRLALHLKQVYLKHCRQQRSELVQYSMRSGITALADLALSISLDFLLLLSRLLLILTFLSLENWGLGLATLVTLTLSLGLTLMSTIRIGRIGRVIELSTGKIINATLKGGVSAKDPLERLYAYDQARFSLRSVNYFLFFITFRVLPLSALVWYLFGASISLGSLASTFLFFSMLQSPYLYLIEMLQKSTGAFSESALFRKDLERGLRLDEKLSAAPLGLIWSRTADQSGEPLSQAGKTTTASQVYYDDMGQIGESSPKEQVARKAEVLRTLLKRSRERSIYLHSLDPLIGRFAHFTEGRKGHLQTVLSELQENGDLDRLLRMAGDITPETDARGKPDAS
ncbi:MAG: hypothetical protein V3T60_03435 [Candidatus Binatia bacterium]